MEWIRIDRGSHLGVVAGDAWTTTLNGAPAWLTLPCAFVVSLLGSLRANGQPIPRWSAAIASSVGLLLCGGGVMIAFAKDGVSAGPGLVLAGRVFLVWNSFELRRIGEASWHRRRAAGGEVRA